MDWGRNLWLPLVAAIAASACTVQPMKSDQAAWPDGIYGNVELSEESGDLSGFEVHFFEDGGKRMAEFVMCEGWCNRAYLAEVTREDDAFRFSHVEKLYTFGESGPTPIESHLVEYSVVRSGDGFMYKMTYDGEPIALNSDLSSLSLRKEPFGLEVAKKER